VSITPKLIMGITAEFTVGCIGVLTAGATTMGLTTTKVLATPMALHTHYGRLILLTSVLR
jgi:hypothetical protein